MRVYIGIIHDSFHMNNVCTEKLRNEQLNGKHRTRRSIVLTKPDTLGHYAH